ncbi:hypothetical protein Zmor_012842 [Zophobas morio]|uniref:Uncharacterized protein n=1 Tax=Zophobas morio TaxID=2755281 RepID=A0AA38ME40_9CUCU|nr:hypothetical protein Zmor_012842 [Zophobas morio]
MCSSIEHAHYINQYSHWVRTSYNEMTINTLLNVPTGLAVFCRRRIQATLRKIAEAALAPWRIPGPKHSTPGSFMLSRHIFTINKRATCMHFMPQFLPEAGD